MNTTLQRMFEANSVVFETVNGKTSALYIEEAVKCVEAYLIDKYKTIMEGCDNPYCPFCLDVKEKKGMIDHIFQGFLLEYAAKLPEINNSKPTEAKP